MGQLYIGIVIGVLVSAFGQLFQAIYGYIKSLGEKRTTGLQNHFKLLEERLIQPIAENLFKLTYYYGEISPEGKGRHWSPDDRKIELVYETELHKSFKLHFKDLSNQIEELENQINSHNDKYDSFVNEVKAEIANITSINYGRQAPCLHPGIVRCFIQTIFDKARNSRLSYDFIGSTIQQNGDFWRLYRRSLDGDLSGYADFTSEQQGKICKEKLIDFLESQDLLNKTLHIEINGISLNTKACKLASALDTTCWEYTILGRTLKKVNECQYCKVIFGKE